MKNMIRPLIPMMILSTLLGMSPSFAEKMATQTEDLVIEKMERALSVLDHRESAYIPSQKRYADLLAERARRRFMSEMEVNCKDCKGSKADRENAIKIYEQILSKVDVNEYGEVLFQLGHLYEMSADLNKAIALFEKLLKESTKKKISPEIITRSHVALGDLYFQKAQFKNAHTHYGKALRDKNLENRALVTYNKAWCEFNNDQLKTAIGTLETLLASSDITSDAVFQLDVLRDLATFYSRQPISSAHIRTYEKLSPEKNRKELLFHFAQEADRIGQKTAARQILDRYLATDLTPTERLEALVLLAKVNFDRGQTEQSNKDFAAAAAAMKKAGCDDGKRCEELKSTMKRYVTELHRTKKVKPDQSLLTAYLIYVNTFPENQKMVQRAAQLSVELKNYPQAITLYRSISDSSNYSKAERLDALDQEVSIAETSGQDVLKKQAYLHYLALNSEGPKAFEVRYQLAYLDYQNKDFKKAAGDFNTLARANDGSYELRKKSADLSLDSLAVLKNDELIETWAYDYAQIFPKSSSEFRGIARKATLNYAASIANNQKSSTSDQRKALQKLLNTNLVQASSSEKILFYTNQSVLAQKLEDDGIYLQALKSLYAAKGLSTDKKEDVLEQIIGHHEKHLEFKSAYQNALLLKTKKSEKAEHEFRLGTLADLAGLNAEKHYNRSLSAGLRGKRSLVVRQRLIMLSSKPSKELNRQFSRLKQDPNLLNDVTLFVISSQNSTRGLDKILSSKQMKNRSAARWAKRQDFYKDLSRFKNQIAKHRLNSRSDNQLQKTIKARMSLLAKADKFLDDSIRSKDITSQMLSLDLITTENERFVKDLASLPVPAKLNAQEKQQYTALLKAQSKPFFVKSKTAFQKLQDIWSNSAALADLIQEHDNARPEIRKLLVADLRPISQVSGSGKLKGSLYKSLEESVFSARDLVKARQTVSANPSSVRDIENLKILETKLGHPLMATYLEARLIHLQRGKSL